MTAPSLRTKMTKKEKIEADHFKNTTECIFCKRANYLDDFHSSESCSCFQTKQQKPFNTTPVTDSDNDQSITEQSDEESSALEDGISLNDDINLEDLESPDTTGDTDEDSLLSTSEHQLIYRNHLLSLATNVKRVSSDSNGSEPDDEENFNKE